jgi:hypothetical protein
MLLPNRLAWALAGLWVALILWLGQALLLPGGSGGHGPNVAPDAAPVAIHVPTKRAPRRGSGPGLAALGLDESIPALRGDRAPDRAHEPRLTTESALATNAFARPLLSAADAGRGVSIPEPGSATILALLLALPTRRPRRRA